MKIPLGVQDFKKIRDKGYYYIDKTELISDILSRGSEVYLFTRPRRFGKSLNLSMLDAFFNIKYRGNKWFDGLKISGYEQFASLRNTVPVVYLSMKELSVSNYFHFLRGMKDRISSVYDDFLYLHDDRKIGGYLRSAYLETPVLNFDEVNLTQSVSNLCKMLYIHHGVKPIVLIDEYDKPINDAFGKGIYPDILAFLKDFYSSILKGNEHLDFAVVTGVMQIAKESIFSGMNNLFVNNVFSKEFDERYGFTADEVRSLCTYYGSPDKFAEAQEWYDGYRFGDADIYNPWSIMEYAERSFVPDTYWGGTSGNEILDTLIHSVDDNIWDELQQLGEGKKISKELSDRVSVGDFRSDTDAIYSVMVFAGYLNAVPVRGRKYNLSIPNKEMYVVFYRAILNTVHSGISTDFNSFFDAAQIGDVSLMEECAFSIFSGHFMDYDLPDERAYRHILAAAAMCRGGRYTVTTESQSGNGRSDMVMMRNIPSVPNIVIEFKKTDSDDSDVCLREAEEGIRQIKAKQYYRGLKGRTLLYGVCFRNKRAKIVSEEVNL